MSPDPAPKAPAPLPRLRPEVEVERVASGTRLFDPAQRLRVMIDADMASMLRFLDGARTPADIVDALSADRVATTVELVDYAVGVLDGMFVLDNERGRARAAAARAAPQPAGAAPPTVLRVLEGDRFDCHACGFCCSNGQNFGPISEEDRARVLAHDWSKEIPGVAGPDDLFVLLAPDPQSPGKIYLKQRGGRCVFLTDDNLCRIHARLGAAAKPHICRLFPFAAARTPEGTFVMTRRECASLERSRRTGTPVAAQLDAIGALVAEDAEPIVIDALVPWSGPLAVPYTVARAVQRAALHALEAAAPPGAPPVPVEMRLLAIRDLIAGVSARLGAKPGEAELAAALAFAEARAATAGPPAAVAVPDALAADAREALASLVEESARSAAHTGLYLRYEADHGATRRDVQETWAVALLELLALLNPTLRRPLASVPPFEAAARRAITVGPDGAEVFRDALRHEVHGWIVVARTPLLFGYALLALRHVLSLVHARRVAFARGAAQASADDAHAGVLLATRVLETPANQDLILRDPRRLLTFFRGLRFGDPL
jgi:Fe-S-cluster containining protein